MVVVVGHEDTKKTIEKLGNNTAKTSILSHVIITQTTNPHGAGPQNLGAHARKLTQALSPLSCTCCNNLAHTSTNLAHQHAAHSSTPPGSQIYSVTAMLPLYPG